MKARVSFVSHFFSFVSHFFSLSPRLGACGRVPGRLVSHFFSFVSQAGCLWSGSRLACLPLPFICLPGSVLVVGLVSHFLSFVSHSFSGWVSGLVPGWLVSHFFSFVSQARCLWSGLSPTSFHLSPTPFQAGCLVWFPAGLSPTSFHLSPTSFHLSPRLGACSRVSGRLVSHFLAFVSTFSPSSLLLGVLNSFLRCVRPLCHCWCPPISTGHVAFLFICLPGLSLLVCALFR